jgi:hypothetical protein
MTRLLTALGLLVAGLVLGGSGGAAALSCVTDQPAELADNAEVAFVGVLESQRSDDDVVAHRFSVEAVHKGEVHRTQDVVTSRQGSEAVEWSAGEEMVVLAYVDEEGRIASNVCMGSAASGEPSYDAVVAELGAGAEPVPGTSAVEFDRFRRSDLRWFMLFVGVVGLAALGGMLSRWRRA